MTNPAPSDRTKLRRLPQRGHYDAATIHAILDEALVCHLGFLEEQGRPVVLPTIHARVGDRVYVHGSGASRMLKQASTGLDICLTATLIDGLILARSAFHHSMNYRSVVVFGRAELVEAEAEKRSALAALVEHVVPGRGADCREPNAAELAQTKVLRIGLDEASAKIRTGGPVDDAEDMDLPHWAGVIPLSLVAATPVPAAGPDSARALPAYLQPFVRPGFPGGQP